MKRIKTKSVAALLGGGLLLGSGNCIPENFWIDTLGTTLSAAALTVADTLLLDPLADALTSDSGE